MNVNEKILAISRIYAAPDPGIQRELILQFIIKPVVSTNGTNMIFFSPLLRNANECKHFLCEFQFFVIGITPFSLLFLNFVFYLLLLVYKYVLYIYTLKLRAFSIQQNKNVRILNYSYITYFI